MARQRRRTRKVLGDYRIDNPWPDMNMYRMAGIRKRDLGIPSLWRSVRAMKMGGLPSLKRMLKKM